MLPGTMCGGSFAFGKAALLCVFGETLCLTEVSRKTFFALFTSSVPSRTPASPKRPQSLLQEESCPKAVIHQEPVSVRADDTEETLSARVQEAECRAFPIALQLVASGAVQLGADGKTCWKQEGQSLGLQGEKSDCASSPVVLEPEENEVV